LEPYERHGWGVSGGEAGFWWAERQDDGRLESGDCKLQIDEAHQAANYAEARSAESRRDFAHKMQICLKELRETSVWLRMADRIGLEGAGVLIGECNELLSIFVSSIKTVKASLCRL